MERRQGERRAPGGAFAFGAASFRATIAPGPGTRSERSICIRRPGEVEDRVEDRAEQDLDVQKQ